MTESQIHIEKDYSKDKLKIYWRERHGSNCEVWFSYDGEYMTEHVIKSDDRMTSVPIKPFIELPLKFGEAFLSLICDKVQELGIDQKKSDMEAGKTELLQQELNFNKEQLIKFINHFTK